MKQMGGVDERHQVETPPPSIPNSFPGLEEGDGIRDIIDPYVEPSPACARVAHEMGLAVASVFVNDPIASAKRTPARRTTIRAASELGLPRTTLSCHSCIRARCAR